MRLRISKELHAKAVVCDAAPVCMSHFRDDKKDIIFVLPEDL